MMLKTDDGDVKIGSPYLDTEIQVQDIRYHILINIRR